jgi:hypothetical protein
MARISGVTGTYVAPLKSTDGSTPAAVAGAGNAGKYTLVANTTYYYPLSGGDAPFVGCHITGYTAGLILTSVTIEDCDHGSGEVTDFSTVVGEWAPEKPTTAYVAVIGTGWTVGSGATAGVVAASGAGVGGAKYHLPETSASRTRLAVVVGSTGGDARVSESLKV